jgi:hypothetical protein
MSKITTDFVKSIKNLYTDISCILVELRQIGKDVKAIHDEHGSKYYQEESGKERKGIGPMGSAKKGPNTYEAKHYALDRLRFRLEKKAFNVGVGTVALLAMYTGLTAYQACQTKNAASAAQTASTTASGQLTVMQQQMELERNMQRSLLQVTGPLIYPATALKGKAPMQYTFNLENFGKISADHVHGISRVEVVNKESPPSFDYNSATFPSLGFNTAPIIPGSGKHPFRPALIGPNVDIAEPTTDQRKQLESGKAYLAIYGIVYYDDILGNWWTQFCIWTPIPRIQKAGTYGAGPCVSYNTEGGNFKEQKK